jgi:chemotaxis protein CheX
MSLSDIDLKSSLRHAVKEVFATMLSMEMDDVDDGQRAEANGNRIVGTVSLAGQVLGNVNLHIGEGFAREITAGMLGMTPEEVGSDEEIHDVIGELSNMIGGNLKSKLCDAGLPCNLSIPTITSGKDFQIESKGWAVTEGLLLGHGGHVALIQAFIKPGV